MLGARLWLGWGQEGLWVQFKDALAVRSQPCDVVNLTHLAWLSLSWPWFLTWAEIRKLFLIKTWEGNGSWWVKLELWHLYLFLLLKHVLSEDGFHPWVYSWARHWHIPRQAHSRGFPNKCLNHCLSVSMAASLLFAKDDEPRVLHHFPFGHSTNKGFSATFVSFQSYPWIWWSFKATLSQLTLLVSKARS